MTLIFIRVHNTLLMWPIFTLQPGIRKDFGERSELSQVSRHKKQNLPQCLLIHQFLDDQILWEIFMHPFILFVLQM